MGVVSTMIFVGGGVFLGGLGLAARLGPELPRLCRATGNMTGLAFRLLKAGLVEAKQGVSAPGEAFALWGKSQGHADAFARESARKFFEVRKELREALPLELVKDPYEKFRLKVENEAPEERKPATAAQLFVAALEEQERLTRRTRETKQLNRFREEI